MKRKFHVEFNLELRDLDLRVNEDGIAYDLTVDLETIKYSFLDRFDLIVKEY